MIDKQITEFRQLLQKELKPMRYEHTISVSYSCIALAMRYGYDIQKAELAGLLHDCAKCFSNQELIERCEKHGVALTEAELQAPAVIHAKFGAWMAEHEYGIQDREILNAISCHTTGKPDMGLLDKIVYIADYIEPRRDQAENLERMRWLAFQDLDQTMFEILDGTVQYLSRKGSSIDPTTLDAYHWFQQKLSK